MIVKITFQVSISIYKNNMTDRFNFISSLYIIYRTFAASRKSYDKRTEKTRNDWGGASTYNVGPWVLLYSCTSQVMILSLHLIISYFSLESYPYFIILSFYFFENIFMLFYYFVSYIYLNFAKIINYNVHFYYNYTDYIYLFMLYYYW